MPNETEAHRFSNRKEVRQEILEMFKKEEPPKEQPLTLAQKILKIGLAAGVVKKRGKFGSEMGGSNYLRIEDAVMAVNKLMAENGLILTPTLSKKPDGTYYFEHIPHSPKGYIASVVMEWTLEDVVSLESRVYSFPGAGYDGTDKGVYKAETGSRKYAIINIFNLPIGNDVEAAGMPTREDAKAAQKAIATSKIADAAGKGDKQAIEQFSQVEPEKKILISRPEEHNGNYIVVTGFIAAPQLERFFDDTGSKRFKTAKDAVPYWRVPSEYEKGLLILCERLGIEVDG